MPGYLSDALFGRREQQSEGLEAEAKGKEVVLSERIDELGCGWYQIQVWILCSGFIIAEGSEVQMAAGLVSAMQEEFGIRTHLGKAMLMTWTFLGFAAGTMASGPLADSFGRRHPMLIGYCGILLTAGCTTMAASLNMLYVMRLTLGFFAGIGIPCACITISEVTPSAMRGTATAGLGIAYIMGEVYASVGLGILMPDLVHGSWRLLIGWAMIPAACLLLCCMLSPVAQYDTPFFLGSRGKTEDLRQALNMIAEMNDKPHLRLSDNDRVTCQISERIEFANVLPKLLRPPILSNVMVMSYLMFAKDFAFFGSDVFWPQIWANVHGSSLNPAQELTATALMGFPGMFLAIYLMNALPRKVALGVCAFSCSVCVLFFRGLYSGKVSAFAAVAGFKLLFPTWQMTTMLLPSELFGTQVRAWGFACSAFVGRSATIISPFAVELGTIGFTSVLAVLAVGAGLVVQLLPETKDCELTEDVVNHKPSRRNLDDKEA